MTQKFPVVTGLELVRVLEKVGFVSRRQKGSHRHLFEMLIGEESRKGKNIPIGTLKSILKDAELTVDDLRRLV